MESKELNEILNKTRRTPGIFLTPKQVEELIKDLEKLEKIRKTLKVEKEETINQNRYWLFIGNKIYMITRKIYDLVKDELEEDENNEKL